MKKSKAFFKFLNKGFTLIELLVVIAIMGSLIVILLPQLNNFYRQQVLRDAASALQSVLKTAQNNASSGVKCNSVGASAKFWKISFGADKKSYMLQSECDSGGVGVTRNYQLPQGVTIKEVRLDSCTASISPNDAQIEFANISANINFKSTDTGCPITFNTGKMKIKLQLQETSLQATIEVVVDKGGSIYLGSLTDSD